MRNSYRRWRWRKLLEWGHLSENMEPGTRGWAYLALLFPSRAMRALHAPFRRLTVLPEDEFYSWPCDEHYTVISVHRDHVIAIAEMGTLRYQVKAWRRSRFALMVNERNMRTWIPSTPSRTMTPWRPPAPTSFRPARDPRAQ